MFDGVDGQDHPVSLVHEDTPQLRRMAVFDVLVNNADRKGGHVLAMPDGHRYGVDHGVTFHTDPKLRTVLWGWLGEQLSDEEIAVVTEVRDRVAAATSPGTLAPSARRAFEIEALQRRCSRLLATPRLPSPHGEWPSIPWPPF